MCEEVALNGGYVWTYSPDLKDRRGERDAGTTRIWVQPPGTPTVGEAMLRAYMRTEEPAYLQGARAAAHSLVYGQQHRGGWGYAIDFAADARHRYRGAQSADADDLTMFDDDTTQAALRFLMRYSHAVEFADAQVEKAARFGLRHVLDAQYANGAWPQRCCADPRPAISPALKASYPEAWSRTWPSLEYWAYPTLNDAVVPDVITTLLLAHEIYGDASYLEAAKRGGDFLLLAQMPEPQPAWAQQYDADMHPAWARRFEPPAIVTRESLDAIDVLSTLYVATGDKKYKEAIPPALAWLERSLLPDGLHARFHELKTNRPLYFNTQYEMVYTDDDLPTHYAFKRPQNLEVVRQRFGDLDRQRSKYIEARENDLPWFLKDAPSSGPDDVRQAVAALDEQGRWITKNRISTSTFVRNVDLLSGYLKHTRSEPARP